METCDSCNKQKPDVKYTSDPFMQDVHNETVMRHLCDECYHEICSDI